jgi:hypothetical protein
MSGLIAFGVFMVILFGGVFGSLLYQADGAAITFELAVPLVASGWTFCVYSYCLTRTLNGYSVSNLKRIFVSGMVCAFALAAHLVGDTKNTINTVAAFAFWFNTLIAVTAPHWGRERYSVDTETMPITYVRTASLEQERRLEHELGLERVDLDTIRAKNGVVTVVPRGCGPCEQRALLARCERCLHCGQCRQCKQRKQCQCNECVKHRMLTGGTCSVDFIDGTDATPHGLVV